MFQWSRFWTILIDIWFNIDKTLCEPLGVIFSSNQKIFPNFSSAKHSPNWELVPVPLIQVCGHSNVRISRYRSLAILQAKRKVLHRTLSLSVRLPEQCVPTYLSYVMFIMRLGFSRKIPYDP